MPAAIFDLNGVFIKSKPLSERIQKDYNIPLTEFLPVLSSIMDIVRKPGANDSFSYWQPHLTEWNIDMSREQFFSYWFDAEQEDQSMVTVAIELQRKGWSIYALSNNFRERTQYYEKRFSFIKSIKIYYSWQTGNVKPDPKCFQQIISENNLEAKDCYYFDDSQKNVAAAGALGLQAHVYQDAQQVRRITGLQQ